MDGLESDYELMEQVVGDPHIDDRWDRLPVDIEGAIANFDSPFTRSVYGDIFVDNFMIMQSREAEEFRQNADQSSPDVTDWEIKRYRGVI